MIITDVNVPVCAYRAEARQHERYRRWLETVANGDETFALASVVRSHRDPPEDLLACQPDRPRVRLCRGSAGPSQLSPDPPRSSTLAIFAKLCRENEALGSLVSDVYLAALAIESGCELITYDRDFARSRVCAGVIRLLDLPRRGSLVMRPGIEDIGAKRPPAARHAVP